MAKWKPAPVIGGAYSDDAKAWSCQDTLNYIPVVAERSETRTPSMLRGVPGMSVFSVLGTNAPVRGLHNVEGLLLAVSGTKLFKVSADSAATEIGTIPGVERVSMAHNQITGGNEVAIANGQSGYIYNTVTDTLTQITDDGFPGAISFDFCDGYIMGIEPGRRFGFHSQLAAAGDYNTLDRYEAEGSPDKLVGQIVTHREWWLFGERTIEPYTNTGAATGTFQRSSGTVIEIGAASRNAICQMDNSVFWLGDDGVVYRANGYTPVRISTHAIEQAISRCNQAQAFAFTFEDKGHQVFYLTFPDGMTWGYDAASGEWHRRQSDGLDRWRINALVRWNGVWIAGDYSNGRLYQLDWALQNEAGAVLERRRVTGVLSDNQNPVNVNGVALVFDTGMASGAAAIPPPRPILKPLTITGDLPDGEIGDAVDYTYVASGGVLPRTFSVASGDLPTGLTMDASGHVTGTRTSTGTFAFVPTVTDAINDVASIDDTSTTTDAPMAWMLFGVNASSVERTSTGSTALVWDAPVAGGQTLGAYLHHAADGSVYSSAASASQVFKSSDKGATWSDTGLSSGVAGGGGRMASHGQYLFVAAGVNPLLRFSGTAWSAPNGTSVSRCNTVVVQHDKVILASTYNNSASVSADDGATYISGAAFGFSNSSLMMCSNGTRLVMAWQEGFTAGYHIHLIYSDDDGATWSASVYTFANPDVGNVVAAGTWTGTRFIIATTTGQVVHSLDGVTWTLSASTIGNCTQMDGRVGRVLAACGATLYESTDDGNTWNTTPLPATFTNVYGVAWVKS